MSPACFAWAIFWVLNPGWKPFKSSSWKTFLGRIKGRIRGVSEPYQGRIRAVSEPYQGRISIRAVSAYPRAATGPILVRQRGSQWFSGLSDPKSLITAPNSAQNQRNLSGYKCTYNLAKTKKRQSMTPEVKQEEEDSKESQEAQQWDESGLKESHHA